MLVSLGIERNQVLISEKRKGIAKRIFFVKLVGEYSFGNPKSFFKVCTKLCAAVLGHERKPFRYWEIRKKLASFDDITKTFLQTNPQNLYFARIYAQSVEQDPYQIIKKFGIQMNDIFVHVTGEGLKFLSNFVAQTREKRSQRRTRVVFFGIF